MDINIGIPVEERQKVADGLGKLLADTYSLYIKTHNFHWNVEGPMFQTLHLMFEEHYTELSKAVDTIAERIRSLGFKAPGSYQAFSGMTSVEDAKGDEDAREMIRQALVGHETVARTARDLFDPAEKAHDEATVDLLTQRIRTHEKTAWMLRSLLEE